MAEFFSTLVPSGPGHLGALATQAAAGMVSFHQGATTSSPPGDDSSASPASGSGSGDVSDSSSPAKAPPASIFGGLSLSQAHAGNVISATAAHDSGAGVLLSSQPAFTFPHLTSGIPAVTHFETGVHSITESPEGLGMDEDVDDDDEPLDDKASKGGSRRGSTAAKVQKSGSALNGSQNRQSLTTAERRATHNAIERARRESLNGRFMQLAASLPSMANVKRPSKSIIVNKSLEYIQESVIREHALSKENTDLRREVDELRARLGMPPLPPATAGGFAAHGLQGIATPQLIHPHIAPGAATIPPELPAHFRMMPYGAVPAGATPMHIPLRPHPHHPGAMIAGMPAFSVHPEAAALLSPAAFHPHAQHHPGVVPIPGPQPALPREDSFEQHSRNAALHHAYAGAIMGNPPAMTSPPVNPPQSLFATTPRPKQADKPDSPSRKRPSPDAEEQSGPNKKRAVASDDGSDPALKVVRSGSISSESSTSSASAASQHAANASPFSAASSLGNIASAHGHSLSALGIEVPVSQAFGNAMSGLGLMGALSQSESSGPFFQMAPSQQWSVHGMEGAVPVSAGGNPFGLS